MAATPPAADPALLRDLVLANRILANEDVLDAFGHVSVRHPDDPARFVISRSLGPELVTEGDLQVFGLDGQQVGGDPRAPYAERFIHGAVYEARPDVMAVCHNHAPSLIPFSVTGVPLRPIIHVAASIGTEIPVWDIAAQFGETDMLVRTLEQGRSLARALGARRVALMRGHGSVVAGGGVRPLVSTCVYLERNARLLLQALALGEVRYLSEGEVERAGASAGGSLGLERAWTTWSRRVQRVGEPRS
jgi:HCOMODA/2-hydroxy-3-carboxy-muconic semialdehyde decarboxylase